jgi:hypothetical protein
MREERVGRGTIPVPQRPVGVRWVVYWCGRILQMIGLVLIWWVLLSSPVLQVWECCSTGVQRRLLCSMLVGPV